LAYLDDSKALVTIDGEDIKWSGHVQEDAQNYAMMAYSSSNLGFDNESVFMNKASDLEDTSINDRYANGMHSVPPPMTGNYMPSGPDVEIDYSKFTYGLKQTSADESDSKPSEYASCESDSSVETPISMPELCFSLSVSKSQKEGSSSYTNEVIHSFFANQSSDPQLDYDDLEQINDDDIKDMDLKWQIVMIFIRIKKFYKRTGRKLQFDTKDPVGFEKTKVECFNCHKIWHFARDCRAKRNQDNIRRDAG
nr:ribonuclease H-like domain-containing protein [Tanacetum cinerariifolium]